MKPRGSFAPLGRRNDNLKDASQQISSVATIGATIGFEMPVQNSRDRMIEALRELPPDATVDDAVERLVFLAKIEAGLAELDRGEGIPHDEVKRRLGV